MNECDRFTEKQIKDDILNNYEEKIIEENDTNNPMDDMMGDNQDDGDFNSNNLYDLLVSYWM